MAHELGHCLSPVLAGDKAEDFADAFAGVLLFPHDLVKNAYVELKKLKTVGKKISLLISLADEHTISPYTIKGQVEKYAQHKGLSKIEQEFVTPFIDSCSQLIFIEKLIEVEVNASVPEGTDKTKAKKLGEIIKTIGLFNIEMRNNVRENSTRRAS